MPSANADTDNEREDRFQAVRDAFAQWLTETSAQPMGEPSKQSLRDVSDFLVLMARLDETYGAFAPTPIHDAATAANAALVTLSAWNLTATPPLRRTAVAIAYWMMGHDLPIDAAAPLVNALAVEANETDEPHALRAVYALMQGFQQHLHPTLGQDLEQSNPERPWRLLNLNFAIVGIRTGDVEMARFAFDRLDDYLPLECGGFYREAHTLASAPNFPKPLFALIEARLQRWTPTH